MEGITESLITIALAYLMGAFPTAYVLARWLKGIDVREAGSGNSGGHEGSKGGFDRSSGTALRHIREIWGELQLDVR